METPEDIAAEAPARAWWSTGAVLCLVAGVVLFAAGLHEWAFVAGALGAVSWFMNMRGQLQRKNLEAERARARDEGDEDGREDVYDDEDEGA